MTLGFSARFHCGHTSMIRTYSLPRNSGVDVMLLVAYYDGDYRTGAALLVSSRVNFRQLLLVAINQ